MKRGVFSLLLIVISFNVMAQLQGADNHLTDSLKQNLANAKTSAQKVLWLGELAEFYMGVDRAQSDKYANEQASVAEMSRDRKLIIDALFTNSRRHLNMVGRQDNVNTAINTAQKALDLAKANHLDEYEAWAYILLAQGARMNGNNDKSLNYSNLAISIASFSKNDSLKVISFNSLGHTFLNKNEKLLAFRNYLQATDLAEQSKSFDLMQSCYYIMATFYSSLEKHDEALDYLFKLLTLTKEYNRPYDRLNVYNRIGRMYSLNKNYDMATAFFEKSLGLADTLNFELIKLNTYGSMLDMYASNNQVKKAVEIFESKPELKKFLVQSGMGYFLDQSYGMAYTEMGKLDSAYVYLVRAEKGFEQNASIFNKHAFYLNMAEFFKKKKDYKTALIYTLKAKAIADNLNNLALKKQDALNLDSLYQRLGDYKNAYTFKQEYQLAKDSLEKLSAEKDVMALEVENENRRKLREEAAAAEALRDRHNIQYMGITVAIAGVFIVLVMLGIFSVSQGTIKILGFFAFIFLFEFIILLADNKIHHWTHGEPWMVILIKIGLISILLPLHHYTEKKVINYITSRKLFELNKASILSKIGVKKEVTSAD